MMNGTILLNLDSEDDGEVFIGCAVGVYPVAFYDGGDGVVFKVEVLIVGFAYHVHVALQNHCGGKFW